jgi:hypothetical protein
MKLRKWLGTLALIATLALGLIPGRSVMAAPGPDVKLIISDATIDVGESTSVEVWVQDVADLVGVQFELQFNTAILSGMTVVAGAAFGPGDVVPLAEIVGNRVRFAASKVGSSISGDHHVATITFTGVSTGASLLSWVSGYLVNSLAQYIPGVTWFPNTITVQSAPIVGRAFMEGRVIHGGIEVVLEAPPPLVMQTTWTYNNGRYEFTGALGLPPRVTSLAHSLYLTARLISCPGGSSSLMPDATLLGGDLDGDEDIDIADLVLAAAKFNESYPGADINADGIVNIIDIVLISKNFGRIGPISITCAP